MTVLSAFINYSFGYNLGTTELNAQGRGDHGDCYGYTVRGRQALEILNTTTWRNTAMSNSQFTRAT
jgi:hypothetical protein